MHLSVVKPHCSPAAIAAAVAPANAAPAPQLLRLPAVEARTGLKKSTIYAAIRAGTFPQPVMVGARSVAWRAAEVDAWCESRPTKEGGAA